MLLEPQFGLEALEPFMVFRHRPDILLEDELLGRGGTDDLTEPAEMSGPPSGAPGIADVLAEQEGFEASLGRFEVTESVFDRRDIDRRQIARPHEARELDGITPIGFNPVARFFGDLGWGNNPAKETLLREIAIEPVATGSGFRDKDQMVGLRLELSGELIDVTVARAESPEIDDLRTVVLRDIRDRDGFFMDIETDRECARLCQG
jgi:hypothetical protein